MFHLVFADSNGNIYDHPDVMMVGRSGNIYIEPEEGEMIPLPEGAALTLIPGGNPIGISGEGAFFLLRENPFFPDEEAFAVGALLPQGYTRTLLPAYIRKGDKPLPLFGYTAVGWHKGKLYVAALKTDNPDKWNPVHYNTSELEKLVILKTEKMPQNRIIRQLARCALDYGCFTAQNIFYERWEGGIPVSPVCNARCLGCISEQPAECCPSPQSRITFTPETNEIVEIGVSHLNGSSDRIISFGQGCEGEPSLAAPLVVEAVRGIRSETPEGTVNINTNAGYTKGIKKIVGAGIDSMRVSLISSREEVYNLYYRPQNYSLENVKNSLKYAREKDVFTSLNLLALPGFTDSEVETENLVAFIKDTGVKMVQLRNLNIDPEFFFSVIHYDSKPGLGMIEFINILKEEIPELIIGNFSPPVRGNKIVK